MTTRIFFVHGKESGPWGRKIQFLAPLARAKGFSVESPDFRGILNPEDRVEHLLLEVSKMASPVVLVGSSMGAYVATLASHHVQTLGLFLLAPAFYLPGYRNQNPSPVAPHVVTVHGWRDNVVPVSHAVRFSRQHKTILHLVDAGHSLDECLPFLGEVFTLFLGDILGNPSFVAR